MFERLTVFGLQFTPDISLQVLFEIFFSPHLYDTSDIDRYTQNYTDHVIVLFTSGSIKLPSVLTRLSDDYNSISCFKLVRLFFVLSIKF